MRPKDPLRLSLPALSPRVPSPARVVPPPLARNLLYLPLSQSPSSLKLVSRLLTTRSARTQRELPLTRPLLQLLLMLTNRSVRRSRRRRNLSRRRVKMFNRNSKSKPSKTSVLLRRKRPRERLIRLLKMPLLKERKGKPLLIKKSRMLLPSLTK